MFHAPIRTIDSPAEPMLAETVADAGMQLRAEALCVTAPWLAALSAGSALAVTWGTAGGRTTIAVAIWAVLVVGVNFVAVRARRRAAQGARGPFRSTSWAIAESGFHALLWGVLPLIAFAESGSGAQMMLAGAVATMMAGAALLAIVPVAAALWVAVLAGLLGLAIDRAGMHVPLPLLLLLPAYVGIILVGCLTVERLLTRNLMLAAEERARRETVTQLLREYETHGTGFLWQIDAANLLTYVGPGLSALVGRATGKLIGQSLPLALGCDARLGSALVARARFADIEIALATARGTRLIALSGSPIVDLRGDFLGFRGVGSDVTEARAHQARMTDLAARDVLTGLPNRLRMRALCDGAIAAAQGNGHPCAIMFLDLDGFKPVNDTYGHLIGDQVLRNVAMRLADEVGAVGQVGRLGGDEFALLLTERPNRAHVESLGARLIARVGEPITIGRQEIRIGLSIGCAFAPVDGAATDELLLKADLALYAAKARGGGTLMTFDPRMQTDAEDRLRLEHDLHRALADDQLRLHYQPIVSAHTQAIVGFEALLRWQHPTRGAIPPASFIPVAEESALIGEIGAWVIRTACHDAAQWPGDLFVSVNLSPRQLVLPALPDTVNRALASARLKPGRLELEVTENAFLSDSDGSLDVLRRVRALGVGIALDDFGTGYSSLGYLNRTIFHTLKIDGSFVRDSNRKPETIPIIEAIVRLAASFRMTITAEGVETVADYERMRDLGCHKIQGYLFGKPMPFADTMKLVAAPGARMVG